ncbi:MAG TPA: ATP synthase F1 subunit gamma, partial [Deltaproteobacteria bacterium]|nr:ATP synthase F1 subunit gamma [Deltaproteobacteria bacterium]
GEGHPLMAKYRGGKTEVLLMTSDRGLCGSFNAGLLRKTEALMREVDGEVRLNLVGRKAAEYFKRSSLEVTARRSLGAGRPTYDFAAAIASAMIDSYLQGEIGEVYMVYSVFRSALTQVPTAQRVLPLSTEGEEEERAGAGEGEYLFEPSEADVLESLLRKYVEVQVFRALLETAASEHGARMTAMDSASKNASEMIASLTLTYNRLRQAAITTELMEIIGGAEALKG